MAETVNSLAYMLGPFVVDVMYSRGQMMESVFIIALVLCLGATATLLCPRERQGASLSEGTIRSIENDGKGLSTEEVSP